MPSGFLKGGEFDLAKVPRMAIYRGFVFACLSADGPDLDEFLGPMKSHIDAMVDRAPDGEVEACAGTFRYRFGANWKIQMENQNDLYHPMFTHASTTGGTAPSSGVTGRRTTRRAGSGC